MPPINGDGPMTHADRVQMACDLIRKSRSGSTNRLARELGVQYAYARRIMDEIEPSGLVSAPDKNGARRVASGICVGNI
ncbi:DNA translocase FtsK [Sphingobium sp. EM0848]|uniref:DNA translocase FtsK n=1 Tax=Sphingobium sp. EM0848 TaxID=2743473 RepID=UPI0035105C02